MGYTNEEFFSMEFWAINHPDYKDLVMQRGRARLRSERLPSEYEFKIVTNTGLERWVNMIAGTLNYEGDQAFIGTLFDIQTASALKSNSEPLRTDNSCGEKTSPGKRRDSNGSPGRHRGNHYQYQHTFLAGLESV
jgi:hypothetical protein